MARKNKPKIPARNPLAAKPASSQSSDIANWLQEGFALHRQGRVNDAQVIYERILQKQSNHFDALQLLGTVYKQQGKSETALEYFDKALRVNQTNAAVFYNRGITLKSLKRLDEAVKSYDEAISINPDYAEAYYNLGNTLQDLKRLDEAVKSYDKAIGLKPDYAEAYYNRGNTLKDINRLDEALNSYDEAIRLKPDYADAQWNKSLLLILIGKYLEGWKLYEWRFEKDDLKNNYRQFPKMSWRGQESIQSKRVLIYAEQGLGDTVQFCRYLPLVKALGAEIIFEVPKPLVAFVSTLQTPMEVVLKGEPLPEFDAYCPLMSLPYVFKTKVESIPNQNPYLSSDPFKVKRWQQRLGEKRNRRIGLVWSGSTIHKNDHNRSLKLEQMEGLLSVPSAEWHSLQQEYRDSDLDVLNRHIEILQHQDSLTDFSDTAALIDCMDLVITVDTSVAHVAGALGRPVWILLPFTPDYRWMLDLKDCPWYPSARLFRQDESRNWSSVLSQVAKELKAVNIHM